MKLKEIFLTLPNEPIRILKEIEKIQKNVCIAGGFISDIYLKKPYKDVDFFLKLNKDNIDEINNSIINLGYSMTNFKKFKTKDYGLECEIYEFEKEKWKIQLIFNDLGIKQIKKFDFSVREFIHFKGKTYASEDALNSIKEKKLFFNFTTNFLKASSRAIYLKNKLNFSIDKENLDKIFCFSDLINFQKSDFINHSKEILNKKDKKEFIEMINNYFEFNTDNTTIPKFKIVDSLIVNQKLYKNTSISSKEFSIFYEKLINHKNNNLDIVLDEKIVDIYKNFILNSISELETYIRKERLKLITSGKKENLFLVLNTLENFKKEKDISIIIKLLNIFRNSDETDIYDLQFSFEKKFNFLNEFLDKKLESFFEISTYDLVSKKIRYPEPNYLRFDDLNQIKEYLKNQESFLEMPFGLGLCQFDSKGKIISSDLYKTTLEFNKDLNFIKNKIDISKINEFLKNNLIEDIYNYIITKK